LEIIFQRFCLFDPLDWNKPFFGKRCTYLSSNSFFDILYRNGRNFSVAKQPKPKTETVSKYCTLFNADKENVLFTSEKKGEENG